MHVHEEQMTCMGKVATAASKMKVSFEGLTQKINKAR